MLTRLLGIRPGESLPVCLTFLHMATVVASFLLAKPIRNGLFLERFGAYNLAYVYAAVPVVLACFVPVYTRIAARFGQRRVIIATLLFSSSNVLAFWYAFRFHDLPLLPAVFYVWVNCYGIIAPVQAWTVANSLFDTRQAKRLFGLIGSGASVGAIAGGLMATTLVGPLGGAVNLLLVLALLMALGAGVVAVLRKRIPRQPAPATTPREDFRETLSRIASTRYLRLIAVMVFPVSIVTQWTGFQFSLAAADRFAANADRLTEFFGRINFFLGSLALLIQLLVTGPTLRQFGIALTILLLPLGLGLGSALVLVFPALWSVLAVNAVDQSLRFSIHMASYELLYLPIPPSIRAGVKNTIDIIVGRVADALGGAMLGLATGGFLIFGGIGLELRGIAAINLALIAGWAVVAIALGREYVNSISESIRQHRLDTEEASRRTLDRTTAELVTAMLAAREPGEVLYALDMMDAQQLSLPPPEVDVLLKHPDLRVRRRMLAILRQGDGDLAPTRLESLLRDPDLEVRTEALLYIAEHAQIDPLERIRELGDFPDFSIQASMVAFLARPGRMQKLDAARLLLERMAGETGEEDRRARLEAARILSVLPNEFPEQLRRLLQDPDVEVARHAIRAVGSVGARDLVPDVLAHLGDPELRADCTDALGKLGDRIVGTLRDHLIDLDVPMAVRRELPSALAAIGSAAAERVLMASLLESDTSLRFGIIAALNKLRVTHPEVELDLQAIEMVLAAEIMGHYRSYQVLGRLDGTLAPEDPVLPALKRSMAQEVERIFRLLGLLFPSRDLHSAYFGLQSTDTAVRANSLEFIDNILKPELRHLLVPLLDSQVSVTGRVGLANRLVGASMDTPEDAVRALLSSEDTWLRSSAIYAIGVLRLHDLEPELDRCLGDPDPLLRETARAAKVDLIRGADASPKGESRGGTGRSEPAGRSRNRLAARGKSGALARVGDRRHRTFVRAASHEPLDSQRQCGRDGLGSTLQVGFEVIVGKSHLGFVDLPGPQAGAGRLVDDRLRHSQLAGQRAHLALQVTANRQRVDAAVSVLREVADRELAPITRADDEVVETVGHIVKRRHPQTRLDVGERQPLSILVGGRRRVLAGRPDHGALQRTHEPVVRALEGHTRGRETEVIGQ